MTASNSHPGCSFARRFFYRLLHLALILAFCLGAAFPTGMIPARAAAPQSAAQTPAAPTSMLTPTTAGAPTGAPVGAPIGEPTEAPPPTVETPIPQPPSTETPPATGAPPAEPSPTATPEPSGAPTAEPSPTESPSLTPSPTTSEAPSTPTPTETSTATPTPPADDTDPATTPIPGATATPTSTVTATPTTSGEPLSLHSDPTVVTPGSAFLLSWNVDPALLIQKGLLLTLTFPPGIVPLNSPVDAAIPAPLSLPITTPEGEISCRTDPGAVGPFTIQAALSLDGELLAETTLELQEGGLTRVPPAGGVAEGLGGSVAVAFPQDAAGVELEVRIRRPLPESLPPTTLSGSPFEIVAVDAESKDSVTQFAQPLTITVQYDPARYAGQENGLALHYFDLATQSWLPLPSQVDPKTHTLSAQSDHLTVFDYDL